LKKIEIEKIINIERRRKPGWAHNRSACMGHISELLGWMGLAHERFKKSNNSG
jgi:hypothetical protein